MILHLLLFQNLCKNLTPEMDNRRNDQRPARSNLARRRHTIDQKLNYTNILKGSSKRP